MNAQAVLILFQALSNLHRMDVAETKAIDEYVEYANIIYIIVFNLLHTSGDLVTIQTNGI